MSQLSSSQLGSLVSWVLGSTRPLHSLVLTIPHAFSGSSGTSPHSPSCECAVYPLIAFPGAGRERGGEREGEGEEREVKRMVMVDEGQGWRK